MSSRIRFLFTRLHRIKITERILSTRVRFVPHFPHYNVKVPAALGFSLFTWLGFQTKLSAEDELIMTIKHCILFIQRTEYDKAEQLLHVALNQAQRIHHQLGITYIYDVMANLALEREQLDKAKNLFIAVTQRIMADGATEDDSRVVHLSLKLARVSHLKKDYSTAQLGYEWCLEKLRKATKTDEDPGLLKLLALAEDWYGRLFLDCNKIEQGLELLISALNKMKGMDDIEKEHFVVQLNDIGTVCDRLGKTDESITYFDEAIKLGKQIENMEDLGIMYVNLGRAYIKKNMIAEARKNCGFGWRLGVMNKNEEIKNEAELCINEIKSIS
ncbi:tetratricopeptide repeat protein 19 homolog, mitochondrial [Plodia interpunctella]|uniref:tetratricopeptide repeat protein 19 homolog, mitochondrial n=1 Tax=Plodia interpunctella TaxID=58824 RepID=UPI002367614D|nr:tetratricopeptide repeat protein 19 homolog, mitochondrial [Plodia interpunctella]